MHIVLNVQALLGSHELCITDTVIVVHRETLRGRGGGQKEVWILLGGPGSLK